MKTLLLKTESPISGDTSTLKNILFYNVRYFAEPRDLDQTKAAAIIPFTLANNMQSFKVRIEGAKIWKVNGNVIDTSTSYQDEVIFSASEFGAKGVAFLPSKKEGYIRLQSVMNKITSLAIPQILSNIAPSRIRVGLDLSAIPNTGTVNIGSVVSGYTFAGINFFGDVNDLSNLSSIFLSFLIPNTLATINSLENRVWDKKIKASSVGIYIPYKNLNLTYDFSIFENVTSLSIEVGDVGADIDGFGNIEKAFSIATKLTIVSKNNFENVTGSINSLNPAIQKIDIKMDGITGGYVSRAYTGAINQFFTILCKGVPATDYDTIISDLNNRAPNIAGALTFRFLRRTSASNDNVAGLVAKGHTVVITEPVV